MLQYTIYSIFFLGTQMNERKGFEKSCIKETQSSA